MKENPEVKRLLIQEADSALPKDLDKQREEILREGTPTEMLAALGANEMYAHKDKDTDEDAEGEGIPHVEDSEKQ